MEDREHRYIVKTNVGTVSGVVRDNRVCFLGVPFAKAGRFMAPQPCTWEGVMEACEYGKKSSQAQKTDMPWFVPEPDDHFGEDCLNLNIHVPVDVKEGERLPVLLEIHGGGFQGGSNQMVRPDMTKDRRVIMVSANYRVGSLGFLPFGEQLGEDYAASGNNGLLDLLAAVRWVYNEIAAFGGDPSRITVLGSSAGAKSIGAMMLLPEFNRYAAQVICSSGATQAVRSLETAQLNSRIFTRIARDYMEEQGKAFKPTDLLTMDIADLMEVQRRFTDNPGSTCMFGPTADGIIIPFDWKDIAAAGTLFTGPAMIGCSRHECGMMASFQKDYVKNAPKTVEYLFGEKNAPMAIKLHDRLYREAVAAAQAPTEEQALEELSKQIWIRVESDFMYRAYSYRLARRLASKPGCTVWQYSMELAPAGHCSDQRVAFSVPDEPNFTFRTREAIETARPVGKKVFDAFMEFVETGRVSAWAPLDPAAPAQMYFDVVSEERPIPEGDVLEGFPEDVYRRV